MGEAPWHTRRDIIEGLENLRTPRSYVERGRHPSRPSSSGRVGPAALAAQLHITAGFT